MAGKIETKVEIVEFHSENKERFQNELGRLINYWFCDGWDFKGLIPNPANTGIFWVIFCKEREIL